MRNLATCMSTYSLFNVGVGLASREVRARAGGQGRGDRDDLRAVDERALINTEERKAAHNIRERLRELLLVVRK